MKFLVTGNYKTSKHFRNIFIFSNVFILVFIIMNLILEINQISLNHKEFIQILEPSLVLRLEKIHWKLFFFGITLIFLFSFIFHLEINQNKKVFLFGSSLILFLLYILNHLIISESIIYFYFFWFIVLSFHFQCLFLVFFILYSFYN